jgi:predicted GNAT superfamily acetyltransferase
MTPMQNFRLRVMRETDLPQVRELNNAASPAINPLTDEELASLFSMCDVRLVSTDRNHNLLAFLLSMGTGQPYASENYRWFEERGVRHQYIDRVVVSPLAKGTGIGRALYESVFERARERGASEVTAEVNVRPLNPGSIAFHERLGFRQLAEQETRGGTVRVSLLARPAY